MERRKSLALITIRRKMMTDESQTVANLRTPLRVADLSPGQHSLVELMHVHKFGRIENMRVRAGQPILDHDVRVVQVARLGGENPTNEVASEEYELKRPGPIRWAGASKERHCVEA
jgi:hypothetical protein